MPRDRRLGILTLHSGFNEGAILQAYCLSQNLQRSLPSWRVEIIDHRYPSKVAVYGSADNGRKRALNEFISSALPLSARTFVAANHRRTKRYLREKYDMLIVGSDEVWRTNYQMRLRGLLVQQRDPWSPAFPNVYWPEPELCLPTVAYAACVGESDWRRIPAAHKRK